MLFALLALPRPSEASWAYNGNPASLAPQNQVNAQAISDGAGGMIVAWEDYRNDLASPTDSVDIYAQRFDASGNVMWGANGLAICTEPAAQQSPVICSDGQGGAIIAWQDLRNVSANYDIYVQSVAANGTVKWAADGVQLCGAANSQVLQVIVPDGSKGAIVGWRDFRTLTDSDVYARRINAAGTPMWTPDGVGLCVVPGSTQTDVQILPDQQGGAFMAWRDNRNGPTNNDIFAQAVDSTGATRWTTNGVVVCDAANDQREPSIAGDGRYGVIITWHDFRSAGKIYAQRLGPSGAALWTANGVPLGAATISVSDPVAVTDAHAGTIVAWNDSRAAAKSHVYAQRADSLGATLWGVDGIGVCASDSGQAVTAAIPDGAGGAILGWDDERSAGAGSTDIFAQSVAANGSLRWGSTGLQIAVAAGTRRLTSMAPDGYGGAVFAWEDFRNGTAFDVYGMRITSIGTGVEGSPTPRAEAQLLPARPNPFNPNTVLEFNLGAPSHFRLAIHDVRGRMVRVVAEGNAPAGRHLYRWDGLNDRGTSCASGVYYAVLGLPSGNRTTPLTLIR